MKCSIMLAAAMIAAVTFGQEAPTRNMGRFRPMGEGLTADPIARMVSNPRFAEKLNLTEEQKTKLEELNKKIAQTEAKYPDYDSLNTLENDIKTLFGTIKKYREIC